MKPIKVLILVIWIFLTGIACENANALKPVAENTPPPIEVVDLKCNEKLSPKGVVTARPKLSWTFVSEVENDAQGAYIILVATSPGKIETPDLWDSRPVSSDESSNIVYRGTPLKSGQRVYWKVKVWRTSAMAICKN